jgi:DNA-binding CsgD family transcriptional regulator
VEAGLALLDESMVGLTSSPVSPIIAGLVYCGMIAACQRVFALDRAREWTRALTAWCEEQQGLVAFHGNCLVHRAQMLQLGGDWPEALAQARHAAAVARRVDHGAVGDAHYQEGEIHRLRGDFATAEAAFELASQHGREPQPGLSLLRLAQGRKDAARAAIARVIAETSEVAVRARHLPAAVEIFLACGEPIAARAACRSLDEVATSLGTEALVARAAQARGLLLLAEGDAAGALGPLRRSFWSWQRLDAPYEAACARVQIARACEALGDADGARLERRAARVLFEELGAAADLAGLVALESAASSPPPSSVEDTSTAPQSPAATREPPGRAEKTPGGLSVREVEVLRLVAAGKTNKQIARDLFLSEKTVDRHLSNILAKLDVPSRAAATAFAYQHGLI